MGESLLGLVPKIGVQIDWNSIMQSPLKHFISKMTETPQNPKWHGEGDVFTHTKMVCESLVCLEEWQSLERSQQEIVFIAALLHDVGKINCTRTENGEITSQGHPPAGALMMRAFLWRELGLSGSLQAQQFREAVCALVRNHSSPLHLWSDVCPEQKAIKIAAAGELAPYFSNKLLAILSEADVRGRIAADTMGQLERLEFFREIAKECKCFDCPMTFPNAFSRYAYLSGRNILPGQELYDDTWGTVVLISGLPGTGKDTYIKDKFPNLPVVSLDALRVKMGISPVESQNTVVAAARELAKDYLRIKQSFVWNATNISAELREKQIRLFMDYNATVRVIFLETSWEENLRRNQSRKAIVPNNVIEKLLEKLVIPDLSETHEVEWVCV